MAWTDVSFSEVNPGAEIIATGEYTFALVNAQKGKNDPDEFSVRASVATPGPYAGQSVYIRYPNPEKAGKGVPASDPRNWVIKAFKIFEVAMGHDMNPGEHPVDYVNRIAREAQAQGGSVLFEARIDHETFPDKETGEPVTRHKVVLRSIRVAQEQ